MEDLFQCSLNFTDFKFIYEEKLMFEQTLVQNLLNSGLLVLVCELLSNMKVLFQLKQKDLQRSNTETFKLHEEQQEKRCPDEGSLICPPGKSMTP